MPSKFEAEDAIEQIVLLEKIQIGLKQSAEGKIVSMDDAKKRLKKWHTEEIEDLIDVIVAESRRDESKRSWDDVKKSLKKQREGR